MKTGFFGNANIVTSPRSFGKAGVAGDQASNMPGESWIYIARLETPCV